MRCEDWGLIDYETSVLKQLEYVEAVSEGAEECIVFCTHPPVVTLGRGSVPEDLTGWDGDTYESTRGGRATYHGPNQLVIYPILNLKAPRGKFKDHDVHAYLRALEGATVSAIREAGLLEAEVRTSKIGDISLTGVWINDHKVASIGIAVRKWVSYHGVAINVLNDPAAFRGIRPCGFEASVMTSLERALGRAISKLDFGEICKRVFISVFDDSPGT